MRFLYGDMWKLWQDGGVLVITTNGFVRANGACVMGRGIALQAAKLFPWLPEKLGSYIRKYGNRCFQLSSHIASMPVKPVSSHFGGHNVVTHMASRYCQGDFVPGWACKADQAIIVESCNQLIAMADKFEWKRILLPRPGCGAGELSWHGEIKSLIGAILDDRFYACNFRDD